MASPARTSEKMVAITEDGPGGSHHRTGPQASS